MIADPQIDKQERQDAWAKQSLCNMIMQLLLSAAGRLKWSNELAKPYPALYTNQEQNPLDLETSWNLNNALNIKVYSNTRLHT